MNSRVFDRSCLFLTHPSSLILFFRFPMHAAIDAFLRYLRIERNSSPLTLKSYSEDLSSLLG
ncbi:MAG: site-specific integrase, partial [Planctomycetaceae bacterium]